MERFKICRVCNDYAIGFNYNVLTCLTCKVFFHRNENKYDKFKCRRQSNCTIDLYNRSCTKCRLEKCFLVGMSRFSTIKNQNSIIPAVPTPKPPDNSKLQIGPNRLLEMSIYKEMNSQNILSNSSEHLKIPKRIFSQTSQLNSYELSLIAEIQNALSVFPDEKSATKVVVAQNMKQFFDIPELYFKCFVQFCQKIAAYSVLRPEDQLLIVKPYLFDMLLSRFIFLYDPVRNGYPMVETMSCTEAVFINMDIFKELKNQERIGEYINFYKAYQKEMENDLTLFGLLSAQMMFDPRESISCPEYLRFNHFKYSRLFMKYLVTKYNSVNAANHKYTTLMTLSGQLKRMKESEIIMFSEMDLLQVPHIMVEVYSVVDHLIK